MMERYTVKVTTDAAGDATAYTPHLNGFLSTISYVKTDFANGVDFTITDLASGATVWAESNVNASATRAPRQPTHSTAGVAALYAAAGTAVNGLIPLFGPLKIIVAQGGDTFTGKFLFYVIRNEKSE